MRRLSLFAVTALIAATSIAVAQPVLQSAPQSPVADAASPLPAVQTLLDGYVRDGKAAGMVGAFGIADLPTIFVSSGRIADDGAAPAAGPDSLWRIYSMTKPITGMAAMKLIEEGKLGLDDPVSKYFPAYARMRVFTVDPSVSLASAPAKNVLTVRHLLTHSGGFSYNIFARGKLLAEYERLGLLPGVVDRASEEQARLVRPKTLAAFAERLATVPLLFEPGTRWGYSVGADLLGAVIEKASGMSFDGYVQSRLLDPLKMTSTFWTVPARAANRLTTNYVYLAGRRVPIDPGATSVWLDPPSFPYGGAGLVSSARDYDRFLHMLANGGTLDGVQVLKPETAKLGMSNLLPAGVTFSGLAGGTGGTAAQVPMGFGAGGSVYLADAPGVSKGTFGWGGLAGTIAFVDPVRRVRGTVMVQYVPADQWPLRREVGAALAQDAARFGL